MFEELFSIHAETAKNFDFPIKRYLFDQIDFKQRLVGIVGARGVGKTTLLWQYYQKNFDSPEQCLYISADNIVVSHLGLFEIAREFFRMGGKVLMIDEVQKYTNWAREIKNIYDSFPNGKILISGSSTLDIIKGKSDLSRRVVLYSLAGLSFREYLNFVLPDQIANISLKKLLEEHVSMAIKLAQRIPIIKHFRDYLRFGYYPFFLEGLESYPLKLENVLEKVVYEDIPSVFNIKVGSVPILKKLIYLIATSQPFTPNIEKMCQQLHISKEYVYHFLDYLERAKIFAFLYPVATGFKLVRKPEKIYMHDTNLIYNIVGKHGFRSEMGAVRECFFANQLKQIVSVHWTNHGDFLVDKKFTFEIGGKDKNQKQIYHQGQCFIAADDIEVGAKNKIPLWLFGMLY